MSSLPELLILTDLDDSLFSTLRKIPEHLRDKATLAAKAAGSAAGKDSFMTERQSAMVKWLDLSRCVPVTARGTEAFSRVTLPFAGPAAIVANGAVMLENNGAVNEMWAAHITEVLRPLQEQLTQLPEIMSKLATQRSLDIRTWTVTEPSCGGVYAVAKCNTNSTGEGLDALLMDIKAYFASPARQYLSTSDVAWADNWRFHINGNNLSLTPACVSKAIAVKYLIDHLSGDKELLTIGVGDSATDLEFMRLCDAWLTPTRSQIDQLLS